MTLKDRVKKMLNDIMKLVFIFCNDSKFEKYKICHLSSFVMALSWLCHYIIIINLNSLININDRMTVLKKTLRIYFFFWLKKNKKNSDNIRFFLFNRFF